MVPDTPGHSSDKRAFIVDDDDAFRQSLAALLESTGWSIDGFGSADSFLAAAGDCEPGLLLLDLHLKDRSGLDLLESGAIATGRFGVVMITGAGDIQTAVRAIKAGALDFFEKPYAPNEVLDRLDRIYAAFENKMRLNARTLDACRRVEKLSNRERDVLERLLAGASNKHIARDLDLSPRTVEMHRARMLLKLAVKSTAQALDLARLAQVEPAGGSDERAI